MPALLHAASKSTATQAFPVRARPRVTEAKSQLEERLAALRAADAASARTSRKRPRSPDGFIDDRRPERKAPPRSRRRDAYSEDEEEDEDEEDDDEEDDFDDQRRRGSSSARPRPQSRGRGDGGRDSDRHRGDRRDVGSRGKRRSRYSDEEEEEPGFRPGAIAAWMAQQRGRSRVQYPLDGDDVDDDDDEELTGFEAQEAEEERSRRIAEREDKREHEREKRHAKEKRRRLGYA